MCHDVLQARTGDNSMGRNLRAARCLDFTDKDDDDGLYQPSDSDTEAAKKKGEDVEEVNNNTTTAGGCTKGRHKQRGGGVTAAGSSLAAALNSSSTTGSSQCRISVSVKRPLDSVLPCQEIQYLDICYQKVGTLMVQYSPIPRKKIAYHHVPYNPIPYGEVTYYGDRAVKRKPLQRSHSIAVADPSSRAWAAHTQPEDGDWASYRLSRSVAEW